MNAAQARTRLQRLNALLAITQAESAELARDLRAAIDASIEGGDEALCSDAAVNATIETLRRLHAGGIAFAHVDLSEIAWGPLWVGEAVARAMRPLAGYSDAVLAVTGLERYVRPEHGRWSRACRADYDSMRAQIEAVSAAMRMPGARLRILFI